ncbi:MAG: hypothetical protein P8J20_12270 [Novosphingobium sp.]|nr:hypothetical protein [Novosphingobium sp.]
MRFIEAGGKPIGQTAPQPHIVRLLQLAHSWWREMQENQLSVTEIAHRHGVDRAYVSRVIRLSFLAPKIAEQILAGEQAADLDARTLLRMHALPLSWEDQERRFLAR